jgi:hypothetical protein
MSKEFEQVVSELDSLAKGRPARKPGRRAMSAATKILIVAAVLITIASMALAAIALFTQTPTYTSAAVMSSGCPTGTQPTGTASGTVIIFTCGSFAAIYVSGTATGSVSYSSFTQPKNVTDAYLIDVAATPNTSCSAWSSPGATPINLLFTGGSITIGTSLGRIAPGHAYDYCTDFGSAPPSFTFTISWTQA